MAQGKMLCAPQANQVTKLLTMGLNPPSLANFFSKAGLGRVQTMCVYVLHDRHGYLQECATEKGMGTHKPMNLQMCSF